MRVEPCVSIVFTDLDTGTILDVVDGRRGKAVTTWLAQRPEHWKRNIDYVAMDMSAEFRKAIRDSLPEAQVNVDHFHVVQLTNRMLTAVRQRRAQDLQGRRGRNIDPAYKYRKLLTCNLENLSLKQTERIREILASDVELGVVYAIKEHVRRLLKTSTKESFSTAWEKLKTSVNPHRHDRIEVLAPDAHGVENGAGSLLPHPAHQRQQRSGEPDGQEHQENRPRLRQPQQVPLTDTLVNGTPPAMLNTGSPRPKSESHQNSKRRNSSCGDSSRRNQCKIVHPHECRVDQHRIGNPKCG